MQNYERFCPKCRKTHPKGVKCPCTEKSNKPGWVLAELCQALGWQGGTSHQVLTEVKRLKALDTKLTATAPELFEAAKEMFDWFDVKRDLDDGAQTECFKTMQKIIKKIEGAL